MKWITRINLSQVTHLDSSRDEDLIHDLGS